MLGLAQLWLRRQAHLNLNAIEVTYWKECRRSESYRLLRQFCRKELNRLFGRAARLRMESAWACGWRP